MARNGSGTYVLPASNPVQSGTVIESNWANDTMTDLAAAITQSIANNGETIPIANLPMGGFRHTNVGDPTSRTQYASLGMVQDGRHQRVQVTSGVDNLIGTLVGGATGYVAGAIISFYAPATNTDVMTLNYNGIGAKSLVSSAGLPLVGGDVLAGSFVMALYDGNQFVMISQTATSTPSEALTANTTGQERPPSGTFPQMTIATGTTINVPAGSAWIVPPGDGVAVEVSWAQQTITLQYLASGFSSTIAVDDTGTIVQFSGRAIGEALRNCAVLGVVEHITGVANSVITRPAIFADDGYRGTDVASLLTNSLINGGLVTGNSVALMQMDISAGAIFMVGGSANTEESPNVYTIFQQNNIPFRTLAGQNTLGGALITNAPVTQYDPNGAGVVTTLPNANDTVIHRLYYMYGSFVWVYGQIIYSSVENALSYIEYDRTKYRPSQFLADAVLVAEVVAKKSAASLSLIGDAAVVAPGGINFSIGSPGGIAEAPIDDTPYGRQNAAWVQVLRSLSPSISTDATITGVAPMLNEVRSPLAAGSSGLRVKAGANNWFGLEVTDPDDKAYFRSYNPANGALRHTTTYDLATGAWNFPGVSNLNGGQLAGLRNRFINGGMIWWQRQPAPLSATLTIGQVDRWLFAAIGGTGVSGSIGGLNNTSFASGNAAGTQNGSWTNGQFTAMQRIESFNVQDLNGRTVTISMKVFQVTGGTRNFQISLVKPTAVDNWAAWTAIGTSSPVPVNNDLLTEIKVSFTLGDTDAINGLGVIVSDAAANTVSGALYVIGDAQIEIGTVQTPLEMRPAGLELVLCQRYCQILYATIRAWSGAAPMNVSSALPFKVNMRTIPEAVVSDTDYEARANIIGSPVFLSNNTSDGRVEIVVASAGEYYILQNKIFLDAEL